MDLELPEHLHQKISLLSAEGEALVESGVLQDALVKYNEAWSLVPEPKCDWEASTWLLAALGDVFFLQGRYKSGLEAFRYALICPNGPNNPFLHLRLGQCAFERNEADIAAEHLCRAYMLEGKEIFAADDAKYFEFLKTKIEPPVSGVW